MVNNNYIFNRASIFILLSAYLSMLFAGVSHIDCNHHCQSHHGLDSEISSNISYSANCKSQIKSYSISIDEKEFFCFFCSNGSTFSSTINGTLSCLNFCLISINLVIYHPFFKSSPNYVISIPRAPPTILIS